MGQIEGTFQRYEKKYIINQEKYLLFSQCLRNKFIVDNYGETTICNIYFDTPNHLLIRNSIEKPIYKEKIRLRSYGTPSEGDPAYIELKKKYKGIVYKRRVKMEISEAEQYLYYLKPIERPTQITKEIDWFLQFYKEIEPSMYISYLRTALYGLEQKNLRITFDRDILWREKDLWLEYGSWGTPLLEEGDRLMEIKIPDVMPIWLAHLLDELEIYPISFSKYGISYQASLEDNKYEINKGEILYA